MLASNTTPATTRTQTRQVRPRQANRTLSTVPKPRAPRSASHVAPRAKSGSQERPCSHLEFASGSPSGNPALWPNAGALQTVNSHAPYQHASPSDFAADLSSPPPSPRHELTARDSDLVDDVKGLAVEEQRFMGNTFRASICSQHFWWLAAGLKPPHQISEKSNKDDIVGTQNETVGEVWLSINDQ
ncbi:hypothetical protein SVAN01_08580 [Stagonosporopsis vannaccii]|nr:hypothetical protein SVAN01_08580 [Stagonosporopsis vannaccii]